MKQISKKELKEFYKEIPKERRFILRAYIKGWEDCEENLKTNKDLDVEAMK